MGANRQRHEGLRSELHRIARTLPTEHERAPVDRRATLTEIEELAQALFRANDPGGVWAQEDEATRLHYRRWSRLMLPYMNHPDPIQNPDCYPHHKDEG